MSDSPPNQHDEIVGAILEYLQRFPNARDTSRGVLDWWLPVELRNSTLQEVEQALHHLVAEGRMVRILSADGEPHYALRP